MSGGKPRVTVVIPIYNTERYVESCIRSVMGQTFPDLEILLMDDGSTDRCGEICDALAAEDSRIRVYHGENRGSAAARNEGIRLARGEYVAFAESDDAAEPDMYARLVAAADQTGAEIVKCDYARVIQGCRKPVPAFDDVAEEGVLFRPADRPGIFLRHASIWAGIYRRDFLERNRIRFIETPAATYSDFSFMATVYTAAGAVTVVHEPLYDYTCDNPGSSRVRQGEKVCYKPFHCMEANRILREGGIFSRVKEEIGAQEYRTCMAHARLIRRDVEGIYFEKVREAFQDLTREGFSYRCFRAWEKSAMKLVLAGERERFYRRARLERAALSALERAEGKGDLTGWVKSRLRK